MMLITVKEASPSPRWCVRLNNRPLKPSSSICRATLSVRRISTTQPHLSTSCDVVNFDPLGISSSSSSSSTWKNIVSLFESSEKPRGGGGGVAAAIEDSSIDFGDFFKGPLPGKFLKLLGFLVLSRLGVYIPLGGVNREAFLGNLDQNSLLSTLDSFSGGGIGRLGICSLGIVPFINAQIVFQLLAQVYPKLQDLQKREGEAGRKKILQYTRYASVGFAIVQAIGQVLFLRPYVNDFTTEWALTSVILLTLGSVITTYIGEQITDLKKNMTNAFTLVTQQYQALLKKNILLSWRSKRSILLQLLSPIFFIFLIFAIDKAIKAQSSTTSAFKEIRNPPMIQSPSIKPCEEKFFMKMPCYDFVWSGDDDPKFRTIVERIIKNNPGREIPVEKVKSFRGKDEVDDWLFKNPMQCPGAIHFSEKNGSIISYGIQTNSTSVQKRGKYEDPTFDFQLPLQLAAEREIARFLIGDPDFKWNVFFKEFPHPGMAPFSTVGSMGPTFFLATAMFNFVLQISSLVTEKELKLRQAMTVMGLYDSAYWLSWLTWETVVTLISSLLLVLTGMMFQFDFFLKNNFAVLFFLFFLFELNMTGFAFLLSAFIRKSSSAITVGFSVFIVGFMTQMVSTVGGVKIFPGHYRDLWLLFPPNPFAQGLSVLAKAVSTPEDNGVSWNTRGKCAVNDDDCVLTMNDIYIRLLATFFLWFVLAIYFDNIIPNEMGVRKSVLYFLNPRYWTGDGGQKVKEGGICSCISSTRHEEFSPPDDEDVLEEENVVKQQQTQGIVDANVAVQVQGIVKTYPGIFKFGCCCNCKRTAPYHAVKGLWVNFTKNQLFCLLGPNGAGKTTAISCLTGITPVTDGDALIYGNSVRSSTGMSNIRKIIGVCPQFDILWEALSGQEHLELFSRIKGLSPDSIKSITETSLAEVRLTDAAKVRAGSYSGGMKRRLSVAIALIGDPKLVILDEPTTGMDPITRRHVWDIIENAKKGRAIILTTHSMEEADILSDRIGIMAKGKLRCIGTSIRLKSRFGTGFITNISFANNNDHSPANGDTASARHREAVKQFFKNHLDVVPKEENNNFLTYVIPHEREALLTNFFSELQDRKEEFGISDIQLGLTTLEEVFLNIAKQAELESAAAEGTLVTLTLTSGESVQIPVGAMYVGFPGSESTEYPTGFMVEVYWEQDDTGTLCIAGHSQKAHIPQNIQLPSATARQRRSGSVHGVVIDPNQVSSDSFR